MPNPFRVLASLASWVALATLVAACGGGPGGPGGSMDGNPTADTTPPTVVSKLPTNDQANVDLKSKIVVSFSEALNPATVTGGNVLLQRAGGGDVPRDVTWDAPSNTVYIQKPATVVSTFLERETQYKVTLTRGLKDKAGNELQQSEEWSFTTGSTIDYDPPVWRCSAVVTAVPLRFDTVEISWAGQSAALCPPGSSVAATPATDNVTPPEWLTYIVWYKLVSDTGFSTMTSIPGATSLEVTGLLPKQVYEFKVQVKDLAGYLSDFRSLDGAITMPQAGRLYAANFLANTVSNIPDIGGVNGDQAGTQVLSANETGLWTPIGVAVNAGGATLKDGTSCTAATPCPAPSMLYVSNHLANGNGSITAYENPETLGRYEPPNRINAKPAWTLTGVGTRLAGPAALWVDTETDANNTIVRELLYVANIYGNNILAFDVTRTVDNRTGAPQDPNGNSPPFGVIRSDWFRTPISFAVDKTHDRLYVANRDLKYPGDQLGNAILAFRIPNPGGLYRLMFPDLGDIAPLPSYIQGYCPIRPECALLGPTGIALDTANDRLYVANRGQNNLVTIENAHLADGTHTTRVIEGAGAGLVIDHPNPSLKNAAPNAVFLDVVDSGTTTKRLFVTTRDAQAVLIFNVSDTVMGAQDAPTIGEGPLDLKPIRIIRGSRTGLGQPTAQPAQQTPGPFGITVVNDAQAGTSTAYVAAYGLYAIPMFDVSPSKDNVVPAEPANTPPARLLMDPMQGLTGAALDRQNNRLYVAVFHANVILVYDNASDLTGPHRLPDRIIGGPLTGLDHPVHLVFSPATTGRTAALFVANQSGQSVLVFGGEPPGARDAGDLNGNVEPSRVLGPPDGTDPFGLDNPVAPGCGLAPPAGVNCTELAYPTGIALDELSGVLYVANRDATAFEDFKGRKILAYKDAFLVSGNVPPTWKIEGDPPPPPSYISNPTPTDKTTLERPAALLYDPALDRLYVANRGRHSILVFTGVSSTVLMEMPPMDHNRAPTWTIVNAYLDVPTGFAGYAPPGRTVLSEIYVADAGTNVILAFRIDALDPTKPAPTLTPRIIAGTSLGLLRPFGLALDPLK